MVHCEWNGFIKNCCESPSSLLWAVGPRAASPGQDRGARPCENWNGACILWKNSRCLQSPLQLSGTCSKYLVKSKSQLRDKKETKNAFSVPVQHMRLVPGWHSKYQLTFMFPLSGKHGPVLTELNWNKNSNYLACSYYTQSSFKSSGNIHEGLTGCNFLRQNISNKLLFWYLYFDKLTLI